MDMNSVTAAAPPTNVMNIAETATASAAAAATGTGMDMGGMDMGGGMGPGSCRISMLWNWYTIDSCFIADTWHVRSAGGFAGSCIGVILLVTALEGLRRAQREFDRWLHHVELAKHVESSDGGSSSPRSEIAKGVAAVSTSYSGYPKGPAGRTLKAWQQLIRSVLYMLQFAVAYFVMLLAMYYNGYIIICILIGAFLGAAFFQWDTYISPISTLQREPCC